MVKVSADFSRLRVLFSLVMVSSWLYMRLAEDFNMAALEE